MTTEPASVKSSASVLAAARAPSTLWAPSMHDRRLPPHDLEAARGAARPANASVTTSSSIGPPKKASTAARAIAALSPWCAPWTGR